MRRQSRIGTRVVHDDDRVRVPNEMRERVRTRQRDDVPAVRRLHEFAIAVEKSEQRDRRRRKRRGLASELIKSDFARRIENAIRGRRGRGGIEWTHYVQLARL